MNVSFVETMNLSLFYLVPFFYFFPRQSLLISLFITCFVLFISLDQCYSLPVLMFLHPCCLPEHLYINNITFLFFSVSLSSCLFTFPSIGCTYTAPVRIFPSLPFTAFYVQAVDDLAGEKSKSKGIMMAF